MPETRETGDGRSNGPSPSDEWRAPLILQARSCFSVLTSLATSRARSSTSTAGRCCAAENGSGEQGAVTPVVGILAVHGTYCSPLPAPARMTFPKQLPVPDAVLKIAKRLEEAGFETWCV